jgi:hemin uptake protein HemP
MSNTHPPQPRLQPPGAAPAKIESKTLLAGQREAIIVHRGEEYRLRLTRQEKLILTK